VPSTAEGASGLCDLRPSEFSSDGVKGSVTQTKQLECIAIVPGREGDCDIATAEGLHEREEILNLWRIVDVNPNTQIRVGSRHIPERKRGALEPR
jgi:hypothetical protein